MNDMQQCIEECEHCHRTCVTMLAQMCLEVGGPHMAPEHVRLMLDCAQICHVAADYMLRGSEQHSIICHACADVCRLCGDSCEHLDGMHDCASACYACAESCSAMASAS